MMAYKKNNYHQFWLWIIGILQLVLEHLVWILKIDDDDDVVVIYFRMVHTRQGTQIEPPFIEMRSGGRNAQDWQDEDPLDDTASHTLVRSSKPFRGSTAKAEGERVPNQMEEVTLIGVG